MNKKLRLKFFLSCFSICHLQDMENVVVRLLHLVVGYVNRLLLGKKIAMRYV